MATFTYHAVIDGEPRVTVLGHELSVSSETRIEGENGVWRVLAIDSDGRPNPLLTVEPVE